MAETIGGLVSDTQKAMKESAPSSRPSLVRRRRGGGAGGEPHRRQGTVVAMDVAATMVVPQPFWDAQETFSADFDLAFFATRGGGGAIWRWPRGWCDGRGVHLEPKLMQAHIQCVV